MKTSILKWIGLFLLCLVLQTTVVPVIAVAGIKPDLVMVFLFFFALKTGSFPATWVGFLLGLIQDLYSPSILGQNALAKTVSGFFAGLFNERVMRIDVVFRLLLLLLVFMVNDALFFFIQVVKSSGGGGSVVRDLLAVTVPRAFYSMAFAVIPYIKVYFSAPSSRR